MSTIAAPAGIKLRIAGVRARPASIPFPTPLKTSRFDIAAVDTVLVDVHTDQGIVGLGWVFTFGRDRMMVLKAMIDDLAGLVQGEDPLLIEHLWQKVWRSFDRVGLAGISVIALSAIDTALWDIAGKVAGLPLYRLLGGYRSEIETYHSGGLWLHLTEKELVQQAESYVAEGFTAMKLRLGRPDPLEDVRRARALRAAIGPAVTLMADVNQGWDVKTAVRMGKRLEEFDLFWLEEPIPHHDVAGLAQVCSALSVRVCTGETNYTPPGGARRRHPDARCHADRGHHRVAQGGQPGRGLQCPGHAPPLHRSERPPGWRLPQRHVAGIHALVAIVLPRAGPGGERPDQAVGAPRPGPGMGREGRGPLPSLIRSPTNRLRLRLPGRWASVAAVASAASATSSLGTAAGRPSLSRTQTHSVSTSASSSPSPARRIQVRRTPRTPLTSSTLTVTSTSS